MSVHQNPPHDVLAGVPAIALYGIGRPEVHARLSKRVLDVVGALVALLVFLPLLLVAAVAVYAADRGPVLFRQVRVGADGRRFEIVKLRSMRADAEQLLDADPSLRARYVASGYKLDPADDPRVTRIGRLLRASSIDELPQFWNVLKGDMSLVGPRPVLPAELDERYGSARGHYLSARPGITGAWQVAGRCELAYEQRVELDRRYVDEWRFSTDLRILAWTPLAVLSQRGAH